MYVTLQSSTCFEHQHVHLQEDKLYYHSKFLCCSQNCCVVLCIICFVLFYVLFVCKCLLPPGDNPIAVNKYIISNTFLGHSPPSEDCSISASQETSCIFQNQKFRNRCHIIPPLVASKNLSNSEIPC